jgi:hypothetical protein
VSAVERKPATKVVVFQWRWGNFADQPSAARSLPAPGVPVSSMKTRRSGSSWLDRPPMPPAPRRRQADPALLGLLEPADRSNIPLHPPQVEKATEISAQESLRFTKSENRSSSLWSGLAAPRSLAHVGQLGFFFLLETGLLLTKVGFGLGMFVLDAF